MAVPVMKNSRFRNGSIQCSPKAKMLYIYLLEDLITDAITEEESTISTSEKEDMSTGLFLLENISLFIVR